MARLKPGTHITALPDSEVSREILRERLRTRGMVRGEAKRRAEQSRTRAEDAHKTICGIRENPDYEQR